MNIADMILEMGRRAAGNKTGRSIQSYMHSRIVRQFSKSKKGGEDRGVSWAPFKNPWYTRKDGTAVPIWGGVPRADGRGMVKGKKRSKTKDGTIRYTKDSLLMQSTGLMKGALLNDFRMGPNGIDMNTRIAYARHQDKLREFNFINAEEAEQIGSLAARAMQG